MPPSSSLTPISVPAKERSTSRSIGIAGIVAASLSGVGSLISAAGGLPEVVKALAAVLAHGWPAAVGLLAVSSWLMFFQSLVAADKRAEAVEARAERRDEMMAGILDRLVSHAEAADAAHAELARAVTHLTESVARLDGYRRGGGGR